MLRVGWRLADMIFIQAIHTGKSRVFLFCRFKEGTKSRYMFSTVLRATKDSV